MSKDPAFLFYPNDWLGGTMGMTAEQKGAYIDLLVFQFNHQGHFTESEAKQVLSICFASVWQVVKNKFKTEGENSEFLYNERLREEINKRQAFSESRRINALHDKKPREKGISKSKAYAKHMGNENRNRNKEYTDDFLSFYDAYPKHVAKPAAWKAFVNLKDDFPGLQTILSKIEEFKKSDNWTKDNGKFIPHPATWLNGRRWEDELLGIKKSW